jgi:pilus assembly protein Flp/PilA
MELVLEAGSKFFNLGKLTHSFLAIFRDESGATVIEYAVIAVIVSIAAVAAMKVIGTQLPVTFNKVSANLNR